MQVIIDEARSRKSKANILRNQHSHCSGFLEYMCQGTDLRFLGMRQRESERARARESACARERESGNTKLSKFCVC